MEGADCIVHLAGALAPRAGESLLQANLLTTKNMAEAGRAGGARSFVYLSFPGADPRSGNEYLRTKGLAEEAIRERFASGAILRVPMILGPDTPSMQRIRKLARAPAAPLIGGGAVRVQPIYEGDVIRAVEWALLHPEEPLTRADLVGPETLPYADLLRRAGRMLGRRPRIVPIPRAVGFAAAALAGRLSPASAMSRTVLEVICNEHLGQDGEARRAMPLPRTGVEETLRLSLPAGA